MAITDLQGVRDKIEWEGGFEYFYGGSDFKEVDDKEFHRRREALVAAWGELEEYLYANTTGPDDENEDENENEDEDDDGNGGTVLESLVK